MPVCLIKGRECPLDRRPSQSLLNGSIFEDVRRIIKIDEPVVRNRVIENNYHGDQQQREDQPHPLFGGERLGKLWDGAVLLSLRGNRQDLAPLALKARL